MEIEAFVRERRPRWTRLEKLLDLAEVAGENTLTHRDVRELVNLYRLACSDLNQARSLTADPHLLDRLNQITGRGYRFVYRDARRLTLREAAARLFLVEVPSTFRKEALTVGAAAAAMLLGAALGFGAVAANPQQARDLVPGMFMRESPKDEVKRIEEEIERVDTVGKAAEFGAQLFTHNIKVSFLAFSLGALTIAGGYWILFYNGIILGAVAAQYWLDGVATFFVAWVGPHGSLELPAIVFAGAAGIRAGRALLLPGDLSTGASLRAALPAVRPMLLGTAAILVVAGLVEGSFSQFSNKTFPYPVKITVAAVFFAALLAYLFWPRRARAGAAS